MRVKSAPSTVTPQSRSRAIFSEMLQVGPGVGGDRMEGLGEGMWRGQCWEPDGEPSGDTSAAWWVGSGGWSWPEWGALCREHSVEGEAWLPQKLFVAWGEWRNHAEPLSGMSVNKNPCIWGRC